MQVTSFKPATDARNIKHYRRENSFWQSYSIIDLDTGNECAAVRFYGSSATVYCVAWFWNPIASARGYGKAAGYGYHKASAAMAEALQAAGFKFDESIHGVGVARPMIHYAHA